MRSIYTESIKSDIISLLINIFIFTKGSIHHRSLFVKVIICLINILSINQDRSSLLPGIVSQKRMYGLLRLYMRFCFLFSIFYCSSESYSSPSFAISISISCCFASCVNRTQNTAWARLMEE